MNKVITVKLSQKKKEKFGHTSYFIPNYITRNINYNIRIEYFTAITQYSTLEQRYSIIILYISLQ
jgi:hypothetical protein